MGGIQKGQNLDYVIFVWSFTDLDFTKLIFIENLRNDFGRSALLGIGKIVKITISIV